MVEIKEKLMKVNHKLVYTYILFISLYFSKFNIDIGFSLKPYMITTIVGLIMFFREIDFSKFKLNSYEKASIFFYLIYCLSIVFAKDKALSIRYIVLIIINLGFYIINRSILENEEIDYVKVIINVLYIVVITSLISYLIGIIKLEFDYSNGRKIVSGVLTDRSIARMIGVISHDPNIAMFYLTIPYFVLLFNLNSLKNVILFLLTTLVLLLTYSRGGFVGYAVAIVFLIGYNFKSLYKSKIFIFLVVMCVGIVSIAIIYKKGIIFKLYKRFLQSITTGGSGRIELWIMGIQEIINHPIKGVGINNSRLLITEISDNAPKLLHNTYLEIIVETGFVLGISYFISAFYQMKYYFVNRNQKVSLMLFSAFVAMLVQGFFLSLPVNEFWLFLTLCSSLIIISVGPKEKENVIKN